MGFSELHSYVHMGFMAVLPVLGAMLMAWCVVSLFLDLRSNKHRRILERLTHQKSDRISKKVEESILRRAKPAGSNRLSLYLNQMRLVQIVQKMFDQADLHWSALHFLLILTGISVCVFVIFLILGEPIAAVAGSVASALLPLAIINFRRRRRMKKLVEQLPEAFELISQSLRAGHSLSSGIQDVGNQLADPAGIEFTRVFLEQNWGIKIEEALKNMASRADNLEINMFVTAILVQRQSGGNLTEILDNIGAVIRDRMKVLGQARALTAEGRLSGWVLCVLPLVVFLAIEILNPEYAKVLLSDPAGRYMLGTAGILQILGMLIIRKIVNIKV